MISYFYFLVIYFDSIFFFYLFVTFIASLSSILELEFFFEGFGRFYFLNLILFMWTNIVILIFC